MGSVTAGPRPGSRAGSFADIRADCYAVLAALLGPRPTEGLLSVVRNLAWDGDLPERLEGALAALRRAAGEHALAAIEEEYDRLFVGLGSGEVIPYASWYRQKRLQALPLAALRSDLRRLGIVRRADAHETEDHAAALCEIMALLAAGTDATPLATQSRFFRDHLAPWMTAFCRDLQRARDAAFYGAVGAFATRYFDAESAFLESVQGREPAMEGD